MPIRRAPALVLPRDLDRILRGVSRSFYLTLRVLPRAVRGTIGLAYLFCRAADTIADTRLLPREERLELILAFRALFAGESGDIASLSARVGERLAGPQRVPAERELLASLAGCFETLGRADAVERSLVARLVKTLTRGMETDLREFPAEESGETLALADDDALDLYCYHVAGCVGEFWTDLCAYRLRAFARGDLERQRTRGVAFGKALQLTNILRDIDRDLAIGRSYLPASRLAAIDRDASSLRASDHRRVARPIVLALLERAGGLYREGLAYTLAIPRRLVLLRLACAWPLLIGYDTLSLIAASEDPCAPDVSLKVTRKEVKRTLRRSLLGGVSNRRLERLFRLHRERFERALALARATTPDATSSRETA